MLDKLLNDAMLSPLLPTNETLVNAGTVEFKRLMEEWTESARRAPYVQEASHSNKKKGIVDDEKEESSWEQVFSMTETLATGEQP